MEEIESIKLTLLQGRQNSLVIMKSLDNQFQILKERLLKDRVDEIDKKVKDLNNETLQEWIQGMDELKNELQVTLEMADNYHALCLKNCEKELDFEIQAAQNDFESSKDLLIKNALREYHVKTIAVEEKRKTLNSSKNSINNPKKPFIEFRYPKKRIKPTTVTGPYIIYQLNEFDIQDDLLAIKKEAQEYAKNSQELYVQQIIGLPVMNRDIT